MHRQVPAVFLAMLFSLAALYGANLSIIINQQEFKGDAGFIRETSRAFSTALLGELFDRGHIVSDNPIAKGAEAESAIRTAFSDAVTGYMDYLIVVSLHFIQGAANVSSIMSSDIASVDFSITRISNDTQVYEVKGLHLQKSANNPAFGIRQLAKTIADEISVRVATQRQANSGGM